MPETPHPDTGESDVLRDLVDDLIVAVQSDALQAAGLCGEYRDAEVALMKAIAALSGRARDTERLDWLDGASSVEVHGIAQAMWHQTARRAIDDAMRARPTGEGAAPD